MLDPDNEFDATDSCASRSSSLLSNDGLTTDCPEQTGGEDVVAYCTQVKSSRYVSSLSTISEQSGETCTADDQYNDDDDLDAESSCSEVSLPRAKRSNPINGEWCVTSNGRQSCEISPSCGNQTNKDGGNVYQRSQRSSGQPSNQRNVRLSSKPTTLSGKGSSSDNDCPINTDGMIFVREDMNDKCSCWRCEQTRCYNERGAEEVESTEQLTTRDDSSKDKRTKNGNIAIENSFSMKNKNTPTSVEERRTANQKKQQLQFNTEEDKLTRAKSSQRNLDVTCCTGGQCRLHQAVPGDRENQFLDDNDDGELAEDDDNCVIPFESVSASSGLETRTEGSVCDDDASLGPASESASRCSDVSQPSASEEEEEEDVDDRGNPRDAGGFPTCQCCACKPGGETEADDVESDNESTADGQAERRSSVGDTAYRRDEAATKDGQAYTSQRSDVAPSRTTAPAESSGRRNWSYSDRKEPASKSPRQRREVNYEVNNAGGYSFGGLMTFDYRGPVSDTCRNQPSASEEEEAQMSSASCSSSEQVDTVSESETESVQAEDDDDVNEVVSGRCECEVSNVGHLIFSLYGV